VAILSPRPALLGSKLSRSPARLSVENEIFVYPTDLPKL